VVVVAVVLDLVSFGELPVKKTDYEDEDDDDDETNSGGWIGWSGG